LSADRPQRADTSTRAGSGLAGSGLARSGLAGSGLAGSGLAGSGLEGAQASGLQAGVARTEQPGRRVAWFHCFAGIAGDMALGALLDAGADFGELRSILARLPLSGWSIDAVPVLRGGIAATQVLVEVEEDGAVRTFPDVLAIIDEARLPPRVHERSVAIFSALASVEGRLHRRPPDQVHFHELGGHDTIVDIVGAAAALEVLGVDEVASSAVRTGTGVIRTAHGVLPNPSPAVLGLLAGAPVVGLDVSLELTTPTGAAILSALASGFGPMPAMTLEATGYGAGSRELESMPNCTQVVLGGRLAAAPGAPPAAQPLVLLEANLDDATGEQLADAVSALLEQGALDAWSTPVVMKKGRPGHVLACLADPVLGEELRRVISAETGSLGVRSQPVERYTAPRRFEEVSVGGEPVRLKVSPGRVKAEHDDAARAARRLGLPVREVGRLAEEAWRAAAGSEAATGGSHGLARLAPPSTGAGTGPEPTV
jgi:uncharacterized protein (TIGR00299 family) protein